MLSRQLRAEIETAMRHTELTTKETKELKQNQMSTTRRTILNSVPPKFDNFTGSFTSEVNTFII